MNTFDIILPAKVFHPNNFRTIPAHTATVIEGDLQLTFSTDIASLTGRPPVMADLIGHLQKYKAHIRYFLIDSQTGYLNSDNIAFHTDKSGFNEQSQPANFSSKFFIFSF